MVTEPAAKARNGRKNNIKLDNRQLVLQLWTEVKWLKMECLGRHLQRKKKRNSDLYRSWDVFKCQLVKEKSVSHIC
jgi:hypothetical protein